MTKRQIQKFQNHVRHGVDVLYHSYIASVLHELSMHDRVGDADRVRTGAPAQHGGDAVTAPVSAITVQREMKLRGDLGCARVREQLWQLQHLHLGTLSLTTDADVAAPRSRAA